MRTGTLAVWQRVYTVHDYYDGPVFGVADHDGKPHVYDRQWDEATEQFGSYKLAAIEPELLAQVLEDWEIWLRWQTAFRQGKTTLETHPALPADRERHEALKAQIGDRLEASRCGPLLKSGEFRGRDGFDEVLWRDI